MYAGELATLARSGLPIVVVVMADGALSSIKVKQVRRGYAPVGTELGRIEIAEVARSFGLRSACVATPEDCERELIAAAKADRPTVIEARVDPAGYDLTQ